MPNKMPITGLSSANQNEQPHSGLSPTGSLTSYLVFIVRSPLWTVDVCCRIGRWF